MTLLYDFKNKKWAFTLAEILITLAIVGVVAVITLPNLIQKYQEKAIVNRLEKTYSLLQQSFQFAVEEYGYPSSWGLVRDFQNANKNNFSYYM